MTEYIFALMLWTCSFNDGFCRYEIVATFVEAEECFDQEEILNADGYDNDAVCMVVSAMEDIQ